MKNQYSLSELISTVWALVQTKIFYGRARLIRRPFYIRGKRSLEGGEGLTTGHGCRLDLDGATKTLYIGNNCEFGDNVHIVAHEKVRIGNDVLLASKIFISDTSHGSYAGGAAATPDTPPNKRPLATEPVTIGDRVWIGENVVVLPGVTIGNGAIIGANAVVNKDISENAMAVGVPAKEIKRYNHSSGKWESVK